MICRLCLKEGNEFKSAFDMTDYKLTKASIIRQHFWFDFEENDPISTVVCDNCWLKVFDFHEFYKSIEEAQNHLGENIVVKIEHISEEHSIENVMIQPFPAQFSKQELEVDFNEVNDEVPFDIITEGTKDNLSADLRTESFPNIERTQQSNNNYTRLDVKKIVHFQNDKLNDHNADPFHVEMFMKNGENNKLIKKRKTSGISKPTRFPSQNDSERSVPLTQKTRRPKTGTSEEKDSAIREQDKEIAKFMSLHCELCGLEVKRFRDLESHMQANHNNKGYAQCCNKKFSKRYLLLDHIRQHSNPESFKCEPCERVFADRKSMRNHFLIKHQKDEDKTFSCSHCPKKFVKRYLLRQHELVSHKNSSLIVDEEIAKFMSLHCEMCKSAANNFDSLHSHMLSEHKINGYVRCCNKKFSKRFLLLDHIRQHSNPECFKCEPCERIFADRRSMRTHMLTKHEKDEDKRFICTRCPQKFARMYLLRQHEQMGHSHYKHAGLAVDDEIARFMSLHCEVCNEKATNFTALKSHMRAKHNLKGYIRCCNKKFIERVLLIEHIQTHLNPACYRCEECNLVFSDRQSMRKHFLRKHPKIKDIPFACSQCSKKFFTVLRLQRHKTNAHSDHTRNCSSCCERFDTVAQLSAHMKEQCLCDTCAKVVCGPAALQRHLLQHTKNPAEIEDEEGW